MSDSGSGLRLAVVTGASSGIGEATALAEAGFTVALGARREGRIQKLADETGGHARVLDVTDRDSVGSFAGRTESLGSASILVNNAGGRQGPGTDRRDGR